MSANSPAWKSHGANTDGGGALIVRHHDVREQAIGGCDAKWLHALLAILGLRDSIAMFGERDGKGFAKEVLSSMSRMEGAAAQVSWGG
jgi:hypothetical protein